MTRRLLENAATAVLLLAVLGVWLFLLDQWFLAGTS